MYDSRNVEEEIIQDVAIFHFDCKSKLMQSFSLTFKRYHQYIHTNHFKTPEKNFLELHHRHLDQTKRLFIAQLKDSGIDSLLIEGISTRAVNIIDKAMRKEILYLVMPFTVY